MSRNLLNVERVTDVSGEINVYKPEQTADEIFSET